MTWSFSRLNSFYGCKLEWKLHYLDCNRSENSFFGQFGSFVHKILEMYAKEELSLFELSMYYQEHFDEEITIPAPYNKHTDLRQSYYEKGLDYLDNIDLILDDYEVLGVEKEVRFTIGGYDFVGYIDLLLRDKNTSEIIILDHKSASIKILKSGKVSKTDQSHFLEFQRQLYLYSKPVIEEYGKVAFLEWNLFKDKNHIRIPWNKDDYEAALKWAEETIKLIGHEVNWEPNVDWFYCKTLCGQKAHCEYYQNGGEE